MLRAPTVLEPGTGPPTSAWSPPDPHQAVSGSPAQQTVAAAAAGRTAEIHLGRAMRTRAPIIGTVHRAVSIGEQAGAGRRFAAHVLPLVARGVVRPVIDRVYPVADIRAALQHLESNRTCGKIVLDFSL
mgnify:CR=1 FL=1